VDFYKSVCLYKSQEMMCTYTYNTSAVHLTSSIREVKYESTRAIKYESIGAIKYLSIEAFFL
jgi:hypothetical protein